MQKAILHWLFIALCAGIVIVAAVLLTINSPYLSWDLSDPELAVAGTVFHAFEWLFVRLAPMVLVAAAVGIFMTRKPGRNWKTVSCFTVFLCVIVDTMDARLQRYTVAVAFSKLLKG